MENGNGKIELDTEGMETDSMLEILLESMKQLTEELQEQKEILVELLEKVNNLSLPGSNYGIED